MRSAPSSIAYCPPPSPRARTLSSLPALPAPLLIRACSVRLQDSARSARPRWATWRARAAREPSAAVPTAARASRETAAAASRRRCPAACSLPMAARGGRPRRSAAAGVRQRRVRGRLWLLRLCPRRGRCAARRQARGRRALRWRRRRRRRCARRSRAVRCCARPRGVLYVSVRTCVGTPHPLSVRLRCVD